MAGEKEIAMTLHWRDRVYQAYVSSGQANFTDSSQAFAHRKPYLDRIIEKHVPIDKNISILDLGCGYGALLYTLKQKGYRNIAGVDFSKEQVAIAHELGLDEVTTGNVIEYLQNEPNQSHDVIVAMDILEHFDMETLFGVLDEIYRVLKPHGRIIATVPNGEGLHGMRILFGDITHYTAFTPQSISQILHVAGFTSIACFENKPIPHGLKSRLRRLIWDLGTLPHRILLLAETGNLHHILTQVMTFTALKPSKQSEHQPDGQ